MNVASSDTSTAKSICWTWSVLAVITLFCILAYTSQISLETVIKIGRTPSSTTTTCSQPTLTAPAAEPPTTQPDVRILIGILTLPDNYERRNLLRLVYGVQFPVISAQVDIKFVFCNLTKEDQKVLVGLEIMYHKDIIILNCPENMNNGKTYTYFSSLPDIFGYNKSVNGSAKPYDYVMKADDDTYFRLGPLVESLRPLPRDDMYYGLVAPCTELDPFKRYMSGMGYLLSWDILEWIRESDIPKKNINGPEDLLVGRWLNMGGRGKHRHNTNPAMYDFNARVGCPRPFSPNTIGIHRLKDQYRWVKTLQYFNVTDDIKPSRLYHIS